MFSEICSPRDNTKINKKPRKQTRKNIQSEHKKGREMPKIFTENHHQVNQKYSFFSSFAGFEGTQKFFSHNKPRKNISSHNR
jgi:hypothetical protein